MIEHRQLRSPRLLDILSEANDLCTSGERNQPFTPSASSVGTPETQPPTPRSPQPPPPMQLRSAPCNNAPAASWHQSALTPATSRNADTQTGPSCPQLRSTWSAI